MNIRIEIPCVYICRSGYEYKFIQKIVEEASALVQVDFEIEKNKLVSNRDLVRVKCKAIDYKTKTDSFSSFYKQSEKVSNAGCEWLKHTEILIQEVENMMEQARTRHVQQGEFRNYLLEKVIEQNIKYYELLDPNSTPIPSLKHFSSGNIVCFNSREKTSDQLFAALKDDNCPMIGLYGRHGSGKTTLVKAMGEKVKYLKIFHEVLFVKVTQNLNIKRMQDEIADSFDMKFDINTEFGRARQIFSTIESRNCPILVIFDDVRAKFDPEDVGIPCNSNRCKILFTTCSRQYCDLMLCLKHIELGPLSDEESWTLLRKYSGVHDYDVEESWALFQKRLAIHDYEEYSSLSLMNVAREVAFECEGLPKTIKDVGSSLRNKSIEDWETTLDRLKKKKSEVDATTWIGKSNSSVNGGPCKDCSVWEPEDGEFFSVGMEEKVLPKEVSGWRQYFTLLPRKLY
jgi:Fe-S cluster biosynthesis and repair protein YggX/energy-coupling factor transporter ATP-binding protein EcfA2